MDRALARATQNAMYAGGDPGPVLTRLTVGTVVPDGVEHRWSTVGPYRFRGASIAGCWLLALDQNAFDRAWAPQ
jgi:hypothetical protein